ncbi:MAG: M1 family metallopeptidase, partial [Planctomycetota bacterium]|nr:M1 family metallopeptidase [Planctomycetota bacterium]
IDAELDPKSNTVTGRAEIRYTNNSPDTLEYLWLHLEQNMFRPDSISSAVAWSTRQAEDFEGGLELKSLTSGGEALAHHVWDTLARVDLPRALGPGDGFEFEVEWSFELVEGEGVRHGVEIVEQGKIFEVAQWFPAVAVYDDVHGWSTMPYIGSGEFYTNFGEYELNITAPRGYTVGATGVLQNEAEVLTAAQRERLAEAKRSRETVTIIAADEVGQEGSWPEGDGPLTWRFHAENVRTVAWAASDAFIWDAATAEGGALAQSMYPKEGIEHWSKATDMLAFSIEHYSERWFPYPYPVATNINGIEGGMEYPMIIFCSSREDEKDLFFVTTHEIGHNWFPMMVNTDERRHAWMDEGFDSFMNYYACLEYYPGEDYFAEIKDLIIDRDEFADLMQRRSGAPIVATPDHAARQIGWLMYDKTALGLIILRETILGPERFDPAFRAYIERWAWKSPRPADFFRTMEDVAGDDLSWFWRGWFLTTHTVDQAVTRVMREGGETEVVVENRGEMIMPLHLRLFFADGTMDDRRLSAAVWMAGDRFRYPVKSDAKLVGVVVDPDREIPDTDRSNNDWGRTR